MFCSKSEDGVSGMEKGEGPLLKEADEPSGGILEEAHRLREKLGKRRRE